MMMVERHYEDEILISLMETDRTGSDEHLPSCPRCTEKLESFRMIADALEDREIWNQRESEPVPSTIAALRSFADRMTLEDTQAEIILAGLLAGPRDQWLPRLRLHPEWRTAGVARKLIAGIPQVITTMPPDALEMTMLSTEIADHLDPTAFASDVVMRLRGSAWRDRAYVLFYVGRYSESVAATERADLNLQACVVAEYDRARVSIVKALSLRSMDDLTTAMAQVRSGSETFVRFGDLTRLAAARLAETHLLFSRGEYEDARTLLEPIELTLQSTDDISTHSRVLANLAYCYWKLERIEDALRYNEAAAALYEAMGEQAECARLRWSAASILASVSRFDEAMPRFEELHRTFETLEMIGPAALVGLDIAEILLVREQFTAVEDICRAAMRSFEKGGVSYTARALTALAYIQEAAQHRTVTPRLIQHVREYIRDLPRDGERLFAPPPPESFLSGHR